MNFRGRFAALGHLPDGTRISFGGQLGRTFFGADSENSEATFYVPIYRRPYQGYFSGRVFFTSRNSGSYALIGSCHWVRPGNPRDARGYYSQGFDTARDIVGSAYTPPIRGHRAFEGLGDNWYNIWVRLFGLNLTPSVPGIIDQISRAATWRSTNKIEYFGPDSLKINSNIRSGRLSGVYADRTSGINLILNGVVLQNHSYVGGSYLTRDASGPVSGIFSVTPRIVP